MHAFYRCFNIHGFICGQTRVSRAKLASVGQNSCQQGETRVIYNCMHLHRYLNTFQIFHIYRQKSRLNLLHQFEQVFSTILMYKLRELGRKQKRKIVTMASKALQYDCWRGVGWKTPMGRTSGGMAARRVSSKAQKELFLNSVMEMNEDRFAKTSLISCEAFHSHCKTKWAERYLNVEFEEFLNVQKGDSSPFININNKNCMIENWPQFLFCFVAT